jgi:hypothetical protein
MMEDGLTANYEAIDLQIHEVMSANERMARTYPIPNGFDIRTNTVVQAIQGSKAIPKLTKTVNGEFVTKLYRFEQLIEKQETRAEKIGEEIIEGHRAEQAGIKPKRYTAKFLNDLRVHYKECVARYARVIFPRRLTTSLTV